MPNKMKYFSNNLEVNSKCLILGRGHMRYGVTDTDTNKELISEWEDLVNASCEKAIENWEDIEYPVTVDGGQTITRPFAKWCKTIASNLTLDKFRERRILQRIGKEVSDLMPTEESNAEEAVLLKEYERLLFTLPKEKSYIFIMHAEMGIEFKDISYIVAKPYRTCVRHYREVEKIVKENFNG